MRKFACAYVALVTLGCGVSDAAEQVVANVAPGSGLSISEEPTAPSGKSSAESNAVTAVITPPAPKPADIKPLPPSLKVAINLSRQRMTVSSHGEVIHSWPISSGREGYRTPTGTYKPQWMTRMHYSKKYDNAPMPHSVFFHHGYAIHATYATGALGRPASHGCIRLAPSHAKTFYKLVEKHGKARTRISLSGVAPASVAKRPSTTRQAKSTWSSASPSASAGRQARRSASRQVYRAPSQGYVWPGDPTPRYYKPRYGSRTYSYGY